MPNFAANLTMLFTELDFFDRFAAAARSGFRGVEYLFPYDYPKEQLVEVLQKNRLTQVLHNLPAGNWGSGDRGIACDPNRVGEFQDGVGRAIEYAEALNCKQLNCLVGIVPSGVAQAKAEETVAQNLKWAAPRLGARGIKLLVEPINRYDIPGFCLSRTDQTIEVLSAAGDENLFLQYDAYHMQMAEGNLANTITKHLLRIAHVQVADVPGRHEPGTGEIHYPFLFRLLDKLGYAGWIGCEYKPVGATEAGLGWIASFQNGVKA